MYGKIISFFIFFVLLLGNCWSQDAPPTILAEGEQGFCEGNAINIATNVSITDPDIGNTSLDVVVIQISQGYTLGEDSLNLTGSHPNITPSWSVSQGTLTLTGSATFLEFETAIEAVVYQTTATTITSDKFFSINIGNANYLPSTGHYYFYVAQTSIAWNTARAAAEAQTFFGLQGYLATITTPEESQLAGEQSPGTGWIGASDEAIEGTWEWVTGPEAGTIIWIGAINGSPQNGAFTFWNAQEPNNFGGNENYAHITDPSIGQLGSWNDLPNPGDPDVNSPYHPKGYLVEFGGFPGEPEINLSASTKIIAPELISITEDSRCGEGEVNLSVETNTDDVLWFESETATTPMHNGFLYNISINTTTTFWILPVFGTCTTGTRTPVTATINTIPEANPITIVQCNDNSTAEGLSSFNINNNFNEIVGGATNNITINYFQDVGLTMPINGANYNNISNPQTIYAEVVNLVTGCTNTTEVTLQVSVTIASNAFLELCDDTVEDGMAAFNLSLADSQVLMGLPTGLTVAYYETYENAFLEVNQLPNPYTNTIAYNQTIYARIIQDGSCYAISELSLQVSTLPEVDSEEDTLYCTNTFPETITLSADTNNPNYTFSWSTMEVTPEIEVNETGVYTVTVTDNTTLCSKVKTITVSPSNIATVENIQVIDVTLNNSITVLAEGEGEYVYALNDSNGPYQISNTFQNVDPGIYTVYIKDIKNDCGIIEQAVSVIGFSNVFTPNGDGVNDTWQINGISSQFQPKTKVRIFDRYGKLLYQLSNPNDRWDGTYRGKRLPSSDYWFVLELQDGRVFKGHFTLKI